MSTSFDCVEIVRLYGDAFEVTAFDLFGRVLRRRMYVAGRRRREWAFIQAERWAERFGLYFHPVDCFYF